MSENIALLANNSQARSPSVQHFEKQSQVHTQKGTNTVADSTPDSGARQKQPFLRSGSGLKRRQEASTSEKRYVPKGGFVLDFSESPATGQKVKKSNLTPARSARQGEPGAASTRHKATPSSSLLDKQGRTSPVSSKSKQSLVPARSSLAGSERSSSRLTEADGGSVGKGAPGRAITAAEWAGQAARPAAGRQQTARPSMRRPGAPAAASSPATAAPQPAAHAKSSPAAEALHPASAAVRQAAAGSSWAAARRGESAENSTGPPSQGLCLSEADREEFGAGVDWDEDAPMLPDQEKERGAALDPLLGQVSAVKVITGKPVFFDCWSR